MTKLIRMAVAPGVADAVFTVPSPRLFLLQQPNC